MKTRDWLLQRRQELKSSISEVEVELAQIDRALRAIEERPTQIGQAPPRPPQEAESSERSVSERQRHATVRHSMPVNDAIVLAVEAGNKTPTQILAHLRTKLGVETTLNSIRTRVTKLKGERIAHDDSGWIPATKNEALNGNAASASNAGDQGAGTPASPSLNL